MYLPLAPQIQIFSLGFIDVFRKTLAPAPIRSVPLGDDPSHRVRSGFKEKRLTRPLTGASTLYEIANSSFNNFQNEICMRSRVYLGLRTPRVKEFEREPVERSYRQVGELAHKFGASLRAHGMVAAPATTTLERNSKPCRMAIFENTCAQWMIAAIGAFSQSITVTTVYATLGVDAVTEAVDDNAIPIIVCNKCNVKSLLNKLNKMPTLKVIVYTNDMIPPQDDTEWPTPPKGVQVFEFDEFLAMGDVELYPAVPPSPETTAVVMYTSGSTGKPKGVILTHANVVAGVASPEYLLSLTPNESYLAYLPLAHIMELVIEFLVLVNGCSLNYADPRTLTSAGSYPVGALDLYKPTHMVGVPKIWDTIRKGVIGQMAKASAFQKLLIVVAMRYRGWAVRHGLDTPLFNAMIFSKFKKAVGGNLRWAMNGGGSLSGETQMFVRTAFDAVLVQAYGLTESCAIVSIQADDDFRPGVQGAPFPSVEIKLVSTPEINDRGGLPYLSADRTDADGKPCWGRGEIWIKGANVSKGYYMMEATTKEVFTDDGWLATGDIGQFLIDGSLAIIDRKKNLVKLSGGEYVALERMEVVYGDSDFCDTLAGGICCYADGEMDRPVALMELSKPAATLWAKNNGVDEDFEALKDNEDLNKAVLEALHAQHAGSDLSPIEKLSGVVLLTAPWTVENGCLTAANKLQRRTVREKFPKEFEEAKKKGIFH